MPLGKLLVVTGLALAAVGLLLWFGGRWTSWLGRLPGDLRIESERGGFYFPIVTCVVLSVVLTLVLSLLRRFF